MWYFLPGERALPVPSSQDFQGPLWKSNSGADGVQQLQGGHGAPSESVSIEYKSNWIHIRSPAGRGRPADM